MNDPWENTPMHSTQPHERLVEIPYEGPWCDACKTGPFWGQFEKLSHDKCDPPGQQDHLDTCLVWKAWTSAPCIQQLKLAVA